MKKEGLGNLTLAGHIEGKIAIEKQRVANLTSLCKWMGRIEIWANSKKTNTP